MANNIYFEYLHYLITMCLFYWFILKKDCYLIVRTISYFRSFKTIYWKNLFIVWKIRELEPTKTYWLGTQYLCEDNSSYYRYLFGYDWFQTSYFFVPSFQLYSQLHLRYRCSYFIVVYLQYLLAFYFSLCYERISCPVSIVIFQSRLCWGETSVFMKFKNRFLLSKD